MSTHITPILIYTKRMQSFDKYLCLQRSLKMRVSSGVAERADTVSRAIPAALMPAFFKKERLEWFFLVIRNRSWFIRLACRKISEHYTISKSATSHLGCVLFCKINTQAQ